MSNKVNSTLKITDAKLNSGMTEMISKLAELDLNPNKTAIIAIGRGGFVPAQYVAYALGVIDIYSIQSILYSSDNKKKNTQHISGMYNIPYEDYDNIIVVDDLIDSGTTLLNVVTTLEETADDIMTPYTDRRPTFIPCVVYTQKKKLCKKQDIIYGRKIKKVDGKKPWLVFPWDSLVPNGDA